MSIFNDSESGFIDFLLTTDSDINKENDRMVFNSIDFSNILNSFSYIPREERLAHAISSHLTLNTASFDIEEKKWVFEIITDYNNQKYMEIEINFIDDVDDIEKYRSIFQMCFNGDMETRDNLDRIGLLTGVSAWRCSYCGGIFGKTYQACLDHEKQCLNNPENKPKPKEVTGDLLSQNAEEEIIEEK